MLYRTCIKCGRELPLWMFAASPYIESGFDIKCTECAGFDREKWKKATGFTNDFDYFWQNARVDDRIG